MVALFDLRIDAYRLLWLYKRPIGHRAQNIGNIIFCIQKYLLFNLKLKRKIYNQGVWLNIMQFLNLIGIINQGFMTAFTSQWSKSSSFFEASTLNRFIYTAVFEVLNFFKFII